MLGVIIGVFSVILLVSLGNGAKQYILGEFESLGTNLIVIQPGKVDKKNSLGPPIGSAQRKLTVADVYALERNAFSLEAVTGLILGTLNVKTEENSRNVTVFGSNDDLLKILNLKIAQGAFFTREEDDYGRRVVVLGSKTKARLFGSENPIGKQVKLGLSEFRVIGVMRSAGDKLGLNIDDFVFIPTRAAERLFNDDKLFGIRAKSRSRSGMDDAVAEVTEILKARHNGEEDFSVVTQLSMMESLDTILNMLTYVLGGIAFISMLVGGIGIMNIMLVNVSERTQEIGIRRAVGARRSDIVKQFISEAIFLSVIGGSLGIVASLILTYGLHVWIPSFDMRPPLWVIAPAFSLSFLTGVIFGVWPALKASRIETLDALRHE